MKKLLILFTFFGAVFVFFSASNTQADINYDPQIVSAYISDTANLGFDSFLEGLIDSLIPAGTTEIHINGVVRDQNTYLDIDHVQAVFYRSGVTGAALCTANKNNCYRVSECTLEIDDYYKMTYDCPIELWYYIDATDFGSQYPSEEWVVFIEVFDKSGASDIEGTIRKEVTSMLAMDIEGQINYGNLELGQSTTSENNASLHINQAGNSQIEIEVSALEPMVCDSGSIPVENQTWSLTDLDFEDGTQLTDIPTETGLELGYYIQGQPNPSGTLYWNLAVPESGVGGSCVGTVNVTAINKY
ncbi:MAG: hypothetical protein ABIH67_03500 [Candidatus Uhrbacteria bacterium]